MNSKRSFSCFCRPNRSFLSGVVVSCCLWISMPCPHAFSRLTVRTDVNSLYSSNLFWDKSQQWDLLIRPFLDLRLDFFTSWSVGYSGELNSYFRHDSLLSHWHQLYGFVKTTWGKNDQWKMVFDTAVETLQNQDDYRFLNVVQPSLLANILLKLSNAMEVQGLLRALYRHYYQDVSSSSLDVWADARMTFSFSTKTTFSPRIAFGLRTYTRQDKLATFDRQDQQLELGAHVSQNLFPKTGMQLDYVYVWTAGPSGLLQRLLTQQQFSYLGVDFLSSGHRGMVGIKHLFDELWTVAAFLSLEHMVYPGWPAMDATGLVQQENRTDLRLRPRVFVGYRFMPASPRNSFVEQLGVSLEYSYLRQWSNSDWFDCSVHLGGVHLWGVF